MMRMLCTELESRLRQSEKAKYADLFKDIRMWYLQQHKKYEIQLKNDMLSELGKQFGNELKDWNQLAITGYTENSSAKSDLFDRTEQMCKLMLAVYSYGPDTTCLARFARVGESWLESQLKFPHLIELLQAQMQAHNEGGRSVSLFLQKKKMSETS